MTLRQVEYLATLTPPEDDPTIIYVIRGIRGKNPLPNGRYDWRYEGRGYNSRVARDLSNVWMNANYMDRAWRKKTVWRKPNYWFRVAVRSKDKQSPTTHPTPQPTTVQSPETERPPACLADCLIKFLDHVGLTRCTAGLKRTRGYKSDFGSCVRLMKHMKKFGHKKLAAKSFNLYSLEDYVLYLFQIQAVHVHTEAVDNSHAVCVFNSKIFDANMEDPLDFSIPNINACCLGGEDWVFHRLSRVAMFTPKKAVLRFILKKIISS